MSTRAPALSSIHPSMIGLHHAINIADIQEQRCIIKIGTERHRTNDTRDRKPHNSVLVPRLTIKAYLVSMHLQRCINYKSI